MTVHKVRTCGCGHEELWHVDGGPCTYGHDHTMGGCTCPKFGKRRRPDAPIFKPLDESEHTPIVPILTKGIDAIVAILLEVRAALNGAVVYPVARSDVKVNGKPLEERASLVSHKRTRPEPKPIAMYGTPKLRAGERRILDVLVQHEFDSVRPPRLLRAHVGALTGIAGRGTTMAQYLGTLKRYGLVEEDGGRVKVTSLGREIVDPLSMRRQTTRKEIAAIWASKLRLGERKMLDAVIASASQVSRDDLGVAAGIDPNGTMMAQYLGTLKRLDFVTVADRGRIVSVGLALVEAPRGGLKTRRAT